MTAKRIQYWPKNMEVRRQLDTMLFWPVLYTWRDKKENMNESVCLCSHKYCGHCTEHRAIRQLSKLQKFSIFCFIPQSKVLIGWSDKMRRNMKINFIFCYGLPRARTRSLEILLGWLKTNVEKYQTRSTGPGSRAPVHSYLSLHNCQSASQWINPRRKNIMSNFSSFCHSVSVFLGVRKI